MGTGSDPIRARGRPGGCAWPCWGASWLPKLLPLVHSGLAWGARGAAAGWCCWLVGAAGSLAMQLVTLLPPFCRAYKGPEGACVRGRGTAEDKERCWPTGSEGPRPSAAPAQRAAPAALPVGFPVVPGEGPGSPQPPHCPMVSWGCLALPWPNRAALGMPKQVGSPVAHINRRGAGGSLAAIAGTEATVALPSSPA